jgi:hypothetical protein
MACPVCFGGDDAFVRESLNAGIGVLLGVTFVVLGLFARFFVLLAKRSRENAHLVEHAYLVDERAPGLVPPLAETGR